MKTNIVYRKTQWNVSGLRKSNLRPHVAVKIKTGHAKNKF